MGTGFYKIFAVLCVFLFYGISSLLRAEKHSLYYIYIGLSKPVNLSGIYQFSAMGLLDDRQIDYYNSEEQRKIPKQTWMKEKMPEDYWETGSQSRKSKEQWFNVNVNLLIKRMNQSEADLHVLEWRTGCEVEQQGDEVKFSKGVYEFRYDGEDFLLFDDTESKWVASVDREALRAKRKWNNKSTLNRYFKGYLEKDCVEWVKKFREYGDEELRNGSSPDVYVFARKSIKDKTKLKLTCLATGFYSKNVTLHIRKNLKSLPEDEIESTGVRLNNGETFQMRKSVEIKENDNAKYDCFVSHRTLKETIIIWDGKCQDCPSETITGLIAGCIGAVIVLTFVVMVVVCILKKKKICEVEGPHNTTRRREEEKTEEEKAGGTSDSSETSSIVQKNQSEIMVEPELFSSSLLENTKPRTDINLDVEESTKQVLILKKL